MSKELEYYEKSEFKGEQNGSVITIEKSDLLNLLKIYGICQVEEEKECIRDMLIAEDFEMLAERV